MQAKEIITKKRKGLENSKDELEFLLSGFLKGEIKEYQLSAWLMAVFFQGMTEKELTHWTELMWHSGSTLPREKNVNLSKQFWIDKHSTGGVGDKVSLILVPLVRKVVEKFLGDIDIRIPMISGRGLGHTGGTLDKLESVSGFSTQLETREALDLLKDQGFFMAGQTESIAPADRRIYSLRDVTGTIESIPLIVSSIMSKKLAENLDGILFDVKTGLGAFMEKIEDSKALACGLLAVAKRQGLESVALLSQMDEPLGYKVGNFLEVEECADFLNGKKREPDLEKLVLVSSAWMIHLGSRKKVSCAEAQSMCEEVIARGEAFSIFRKMFESQNGNFQAFEEERDQFRDRYLTWDYLADCSGILSEMHARKLGVLLVELGGGRAVKEDSIDGKVGFEVFKKVGDEVKEGEPLIRVYHRSASEIENIKETLKESIKMVNPSGIPFKKTPILREVLT